MSLNRAKKTIRRSLPRLLNYSKKIVAKIQRKRTLPIENIIRKKLIMTLVVKNEADIISQNIEFHKSMGVDHIYVTDNNSSDNTRALLRNYVADGFITLIDEPSSIFRQEEWVNRMADMAFSKYGECLIFHADADEIWYSDSGNLKLEFAKSNMLQCLYVPMAHVLLRDRAGSESFPDDSIYIKKTTEARGLYKAFFKATDHMPYVVTGNHDLVNRDNYIKLVSEDIFIFHFSIRNYKSFLQKATSSANAIMANSNYSKDIGFHWREYNQAHLSGDGYETYKKEAVLEKDQAENMIAQGEVIKAERLIEKLIAHEFNALKKIRSKRKQK